ncbi:MAG: S9 family peptidase [Gemmatimonadales bacterium]
MRIRRFARALASLALGAAGLASAQTLPIPADRFGLEDVFELEWAADPQISPDGSRIVFVRSGFDKLTDGTRASLWTVNADGSDLRALLAPDRRAGSPRWSPDGRRLLFVSRGQGGAQLFVRWMDTGQEAELTHLSSAPGGLAWSPDGKWIAFTMFVPEAGTPLVSLPSPPEGADWGPPIKYIDQIFYRADGEGYLERGRRHIFVLPAEGGTPRQLTTGPYDHGAPRWTPDGRAILFSANRRPDADYQPNDSEIYEVQVRSGEIKQLTDRRGPDDGPAISPDGAWIAYTGYDDRFQGYQVTRLYLMKRDGSGSRLLSERLDRDVGTPVWRADGKGLVFQYDDLGDTKVAFIDLAGSVTDLASGVGGLDLGRPYGGGSFSLASTGRFAFTATAPDHPADVAVAGPTGAATRLTRLNDDLFGMKPLGSVEEIWYTSGFDGRNVQGWIAKPPGFDPSRKYPLVLEIHGGPFANYGVRYSSEVQLYASAGYVVLYTNPRGSTSYGEDFGNLIHHDYPNHDFDDLMSGVDAVIAKGYVDPANLFVTGGSGGGVLTAWIVGHTDRFRAAVVAKPVINWYSFVLTADGLPFFSRYWFPGPPWEHAEHYMKRSPISYVGNVTTPTMLMVGEEDWRTPASESEQFYGALIQRKVPTAMVRVPDAPHGIAGKPSNLMAKAGYILGWFERYRRQDPKATGGR